MRAGGSPPATPTSRMLLTVCWKPFNEGRGFTPGDTLSKWVDNVRGGCTFNEGRGFTPGDTVEDQRRPQRVVIRRSMRAGGSPPATRERCEVFTVRHRRSMRAGGSPPATPVC